MGWGPFETLGDLASFIALIATVVGVFLGVRGNIDKALEQVRRCRSIQRRVGKEIWGLRRAFIRVARCLSEEADESEIERILCNDTNVVEELADFAESKCPDLDKDLIKAGLWALGLGVVYIVYGFFTGNYAAALFFSLLGLVPFVYHQNTGYVRVREFTLQLDDIEDKLNDIQARLRDLRTVCEERGVRV